MKINVDPKSSLKNNILKLREKESILPENAHIDLDVRLKLHELGVSSWDDGEPVKQVSRFIPPLRPMLVERNMLVLDLELDERRHVISGKEWLRRQNSDSDNTVVMLSSNDSLTIETQSLDLTLVEDSDGSIIISSDCCDLLVLPQSKDSVRIKEKRNKQFDKEINNRIEFAAVESERAIEKGDVKKGEYHRGVASGIRTAKAVFDNW